MYKSLFLFLCPLVVACTATEQRSSSPQEASPSLSESAPASSTSRPYKPLSAEERAELFASVAHVSTQSREHREWMRSNLRTLEDDQDCISVLARIQIPKNQHVFFEPGGSIFARVMVEDGREVLLTLSAEIDGEVISQEGLARQMVGNHAIPRLLNIPIARPAMLEAGSTQTLVIRARAIGLRRPVKVALLPLFFEVKAVEVRVERNTREF